MCVCMYVYRLLFCSVAFAVLLTQYDKARDIYNNSQKMTSVVVASSSASGRLLCPCRVHALIEHCVPVKNVRLGPRDGVIHHFSYH